MVMMFSIASKSLNQSRFRKDVTSIFEIRFHEKRKIFRSNIDWNCIDECSTILLFYFITVSALCIYIVYFIKCNKKISLHKKAIEWTNIQLWKMKELVSDGILDTWTSERILTRRVKPPSLRYQKLRKMTNERDLGFDSRFRDPLLWILTALHPYELFYCVCTHKSYDIEKPNLKDTRFQCVSSHVWAMFI